MKMEYTKFYMTLHNIAQDNNINFDIISVSHNYYDKHIQKFGNYRHILSDRQYHKLMHSRQLWILNKTSRTLDYLIRCNERKQNEV